MKPMTYEEFKAAYNQAFAQMMKYGSGQIGSNIWAARMAELADTYPAWAVQVEESNGD